MQVSAVIVTRGDVDLGPVLSAIEADEVIVRRGNGGVWERYEAAMAAKHEVVYTQDDDCVVEYAEVIATYESGRVTCNMPEYKRAEYPDGIALVGWGAVFHRAEVFAAFQRYFRLWSKDALFNREADRVFTGLSRLKLIDAPFQHLRHAHGADRLGAQPDHLANLGAIRERIYACR